MAALLPEKVERVAKKKAPKVQQDRNLKLNQIEVVSEEEIAKLTTSEWDPEPAYTDPTMDSSCCRALLLEIMRRAAYDWVLYRTDSKIQNKKLAEDAYYWLFEEDETSPSWQERIAEDKLMTAFIVICDSLDLDPDNVRKYIRKLTIKNVMSVGRPAERRKQPVEEMGGDEHYVHNIDVGEIPIYDPTFGGSVS